ALSAYASALTGFLGGSWQIFAANPQIGRGSPEAREKLTEWLASEQITPDRATERLADAIQLLKKLQSEFRARFPSHELDAFERQEHAALWQLWAVWYDFAYHPRRRIENAARDSVAAIDARIEERRRSLRKRLRALEQSTSEILAENEEGLWLTVDVQHPPLVVGAFAEALVQATEVLRPQPESTFDRYVFDLVWQHIHLVPLVRGRSLARKTWRLRIIGLPLPGEDMAAQAWKFVQRSVSDATWERLGLPSWSRAVAPDARRFLPVVNAWRDSITHLASLRDVPRNDAQATAIVTSHWRDVVAVADRQAAEVEDVIAAIPSTLFSRADDAVAILQKFTSTLRATIASAEPLSFDAMAEAKDAIADTLVQAASAISDVWLDQHLP
ncbi:MAG TPA: hypothetical protein VHK90_04295, partial [Thermoanaerobaculia bacterium]|nr:hypothetical protein [Thermoanaerobaculia bacterium]